MASNTGKISQIIGPVVDVVFEGKENSLPNIYDSLEVQTSSGKLVLEVQSHIGEDTVRTISMDSTDGLSRGAKVAATGNPIQMPIGDDVYGRRLLARSVARLSDQSRGLGRFQLIVPTLLVVGSAKLPQLDLLPAFLGFLLYKPALILQHVFDDR